MTILSQPSSAGKIIHKIDIGEVSLSLQHPLGLAKLKYQHGRLHGLGFLQDKSDKLSDPSSDFSRSCYETRLACPTVRASTYCMELIRPAPNKHAVTSSPHVRQSARRKRLRSSSDSIISAKATTATWKRSRQLPESLPSLNLHKTNRQNHAPFMSEVLLSELFSPTCSGASGEENDPDLPLPSFQMISPMANSSRPPPKHAHLPRGEFGLNDRADLLLHLDTSPTRICVAGGCQKDFLPCTPPNKYVPLPTPTPDLGTPSQQFNFHDFVNVMSSPAQPVWGSHFTSI